MSASESQRPQMPRMPWYPSSFFATTRTWPLIARAIYRELLDISWDAGGLPPDPKTLQSMIGATASEWSRAWPLVAPKFSPGPDGLLRNDRLEKHRTEAIELHKMSHLKAKDAAVKRWRVRPL